MTSPVVFVDCETTGTDDRYHDAWDVAVVWPDEQYEFRFRPPLTHADPAALRIGDYYARTLDEARLGEAPFRVWSDDTTIRPGTGDPNDPGRWYPARVIESARTLAHVTDGVTLVGVNPQFDARFITKIIRTHGYEPTWQYRLIDLNSMARGYLLGLAHGAGGQQQVDVTSGSETLSRACGVDRPADHTALGDARWARDWYQTMTGDLT